MSIRCVERSVRSAAITRLPRYKRVGDYPEIRIGRPRRLILQALARFHYLTATQLAALAFSPTSISYVRAHLAALYQAAYVDRLYLPLMQPRGSPFAVYSLDQKGANYLRRMGGAPRGRFRASEEHRRGGGALAHALETNDFLILCYRLARSFPAVSVGEVRTERDLRRAPMRVEVGRRRVALIPDGWVDLHLDGSARMSLAIELDRGTMERRAFQEKIRAYCRATRGEYQRVFTSPSLSVLFVITAATPRLSQLLAWTEAVLRQEGNEGFWDLFRFAAIEPGSVAPARAFFEEVWRRPFDRKPLPLLAQGTSGPEQAGERSA